MLDSFYSTLFHPSDRPRLALAPAIGILFLLALLLALLAASGYGPLMVIAVTFLVAASLLVFWLFFGGALLLVDRLFGGKLGEGELLGAVAESAWPLLLLAPAAALGRIWPWMDGLFAFLAWLWGFVALAGRLKGSEGWGWGRALAGVALAAFFLLGGLGILILFPAIVVFLLLD